MTGNTDYLGPHGHRLCGRTDQRWQFVNANALTGTAQEFKAQDLVRDPATGALLVGGYFYNAPVANFAVARVDHVVADELHRPAVHVDRFARGAYYRRFGHRWCRTSSPISPSPALPSLPPSALPSNVSPRR
ncbi:MAG: hypothetical protein IPG10_19760 [Flavobacteriales bacterium]|nr:hypothetical protein [Flavobacteriales bacterium]